MYPVDPPESVPCSCPGPEKADWGNIFKFPDPNLCKFGTAIPRRAYMFNSGE
jgi:hypothetical protein